MVSSCKIVYNVNDNKNLWAMEEDREKQETEEKRKKKNFFKRN